jgi:hypothetical protein
MGLPVGGGVYSHISYTYQPGKMGESETFYAACVDINNSSDATQYF